MRTAAKRRTPLSAQSAVALGFAGLILLIMFLLMLPVSSKSGCWSDPLTALFTAASAVCVTGLVVVDTATYWSLFGQIVILSAIQIGGLGVMTVIILAAMMLGRRVSLRQRTLLTQSISILHAGGVVRLIRRAALISLLAEGAGAVLLSIRFVPMFGLKRGVFFGVFHAVSAFCNAGFDLMGERFSPYVSLEPFSGDPLVCLTMILLILSGGLGFFVWDDLLACRLRPRHMQLHTRIVLLITPFVLFLPALLFFFLESGASMRDMNLSSRILASLFAAVTPRTAGFNTVPTDALSPGGFLLTLVLMLIGGNPGSTAGGAKTTTILILILLAASVTRDEGDIHLLGRRLADDLMRRACSIVILYIAIALAAALALCAMQPQLGLDPILFEVFSAINTVGMTTGVTRLLSSASRIILILLMYAGRLGSLTFAVLIVRREKPSPLRCPVDHLLIG